MGTNNISETVDRLSSLRRSQLSSPVHVINVWWSSDNCWSHPPSRSVFSRNGLITVWCDAEYLSCTESPRLGGIKYSCSYSCVDTEVIKCIITSSLAWGELCPDPLPVRDSRSRSSCRSVSAHAYNTVSSPLLRSQYANTHQNIISMTTLWSRWCIWSAVCVSVCFWTITFEQNDPYK